MSAARIAEARRVAAQRFADWVANVHATLEDAPEASGLDIRPIEAIRAARQASELAQSAISGCELAELGAALCTLGHLSQSMTPWAAARQMFGGPQ